MEWLILLALVLIFPKIFIGIFNLTVGVLWIIILGVIGLIAIVIDVLSNLVR